MPLVVVRHVAVGDLRKIERTYIAARRPTACATAALAPSAYSPDIDELPATVLDLVTKARDESRHVQQGYDRDAQVRVPLPALTRADRAMRRALDAQVALYDEMVSDPKDSDPELRALGRANAALERDLASARRQLVSGPTAGWNRRFVCGP